MDFDIDFNLVRSQKLLLIPQLKQALEILEMSSQELFEYVEKQMESNPILEVVMEDRPQYEPQEDETEALPPEDTASELTLKEHLLLQLNSLNLDRNTLSIGEYLVDNTDDNGYLKAEIGEVAGYFNVTHKKVEDVLAILQSFEPSGICARNLKECLLLQIRQMDDMDERLFEIVRDHLDELASNDTKAVSDALGTDMSTVNGLFKVIRNLEPRPGREFYRNENARTLTSDIIVRRINGTFEALVNEDAFPEINIPEEYSHKGKTGVNHTIGEAGAYEAERLNSAVWLIKCVEQRKNILLKISQKLINQSAPFFNKGPQKLALLDPKPFADAIDMHETIFCKALNEKYLQCQWSTFGFRSFFDLEKLES